MGRNLIGVNDFTLQDIEKVFEFARELKHSPESFHKSFPGKMFGLVFEKPSTRTWVSFETGITALGGGVIYLGPEDIKLGVREEVKDVARVLSRYLEGVILRTFSHETIVEFSQHFNKTIINGLSDQEHPCQALADFFTINEKMEDGTDPKITYIGDGNNVLASLVRVAALLGARFHFATPEKYALDPQVLTEAQAVAKSTGGEISASTDPVATIEDADVVYTDVWVSMGEEKQREEKLKAFKHMQINRDLLNHAKPGVQVMHCLPAHRGEEITDEVIESKNSIVFDQAENRLHVQKAILLLLCQSQGAR